MKKITLPAIIIIACSVLISCGKGITPHEAANGKVKCGRYIR